MIPVINIEDLNSDETRRELDSACRGWGVFQIVGHGIESEALTRVHLLMRNFFEQEHNRKELVMRSLANPWGFYDRELTKNIRDRKEVFDIGPCDDVEMVSQWPRDNPEFRGVLQSHYLQCEKLSFRILAAIVANLGTAAKQVEGYFKPDNTSFLRLNYYPIPKSQAGSVDGTTKGSPLGVNLHTDAGALTILLQDRQAGLEILKDDRWQLVEPQEGALVVNIGDIVQVWSNDRYKAPVHRVRASTLQQRFSAPFFFNPTYATDYRPLDSIIDSLNPPHYRVINWGEFRDRRAGGDYADYGDEVQISQFRIEREV